MTVGRFYCRCVVGGAMGRSIQEPSARHSSESRNPATSILFRSFKCKAFTRYASESLLCSCKEVTKKTRLFFTYGVFADATSLCRRRTRASMRALAFSWVLAFLFLRFVVWRAGLLRAGDTHFCAGCDSVGWAFDDFVVGFQTAADFDGFAKIASHHHGFDGDAIVAANGGDGKSLRIENQRTRRNAENADVVGKIQAYIGVAARKQFALSVI